MAGEWLWMAGAMNGGQDVRGIARPGPLINRAVAVVQNGIVENFLATAVGVRTRGEPVSVTETDIDAGEEAYDVTKLRQIVRYLGVTTGDMEQGAMHGNGENDGLTGKILVVDDLPG